MAQIDKSSLFFSQNESDFFIIIGDRRIPGI
jgi:hypothetical protein